MTDTPEIRVERIGLATLYLAKWQDVPDLPRPAAIITDPPYGQRLKTNVVTGPKKRPGRSGFIQPKVSLYPAAIAGDDTPFDPSSFLRAADITLFWGAHKFADRLPPGQMLCWDKNPKGTRRCHGDGEIAWLNSPGKPMRIFRYLWSGICMAAGYETQNEICHHSSAQRRVHPTQKPVDLMTWCIEQARVPEGGLILDPYMGGGSTGIAAVRAGHPFIGIECEPQYFEAACRRIRKAQEMQEAA